MSALTRVLLGAACVVAIAFFALGIRQHDAQSAGAAVAGSAHPSAAAAARAGASLRRAGQLNPDQTVVITRAQLALARGQAPRARALLRSVVRAEPRNLTAWIGLTRTAPDRHAKAVAFAHVLALAPPVR